VDLKTLKAVRTVQTGANPDAILYEPRRHEVYTFNGRGQSATVFEAQTGKIVATIPLEGKPEAPVFDPGTDRVFVNIEDKATVAVLDAIKHSVITTWPLTGCEEPTGIALDAAHHRLFSVCANKVIVALDTHSGKVVGRAPIGARPDGAAFDPGTGYVFSSNGEGTLTILSWKGDDLRVVQTVKTQSSARTIALDPDTHQVFLPAATMGAAAEGQRPQALPDTFKVLVLGMATASAP
jgi:DNA-binding beta-propeller fold protein YncE